MTIILMILLAISLWVQAYYLIKGLAGKAERDFAKTSIVIISVTYVCVFVIAMLTVAIQMTYENKLLSEKQIKKILVIENSQSLTLREIDIIKERNKDMHKIMFEEEERNEEI